MRTVGGLSEDDALRIAAAVEQDAEHPVAHAIVASATERKLTVPRANDFHAILGHGVQATIDGRAVSDGGPNLLKRLGVEPPPELQQFAQGAAARGQSVIYQVENGQVQAAFSVADAIRPESAEAIQRLHDSGVQVAMVTGDSRAVAEAVARELKIDTVFAEVLPDNKLVRSDPRDIPRIIALSRATYPKMLQNRWWAAGYNIVAIRSPPVRWRREALS